MKEENIREDKGVYIHPIETYMHTGYTRGGYLDGNFLPNEYSATSVCIPNLERGARRSFVFVSSISFFATEAAVLLTRSRRCVHREAKRGECICRLLQSMWRVLFCFVFFVEAKPNDGDSR